MTFDRPLERACAIPPVVPFHKQELFGLVTTADNKSSAPGFQNTTLEHIQFKVQDFFNCLMRQRLEYHHFVQPVNKLRGKPATGCLDRDLFQPVVDFQRSWSDWLETHLSFRLHTHLTSAEVGSHDNNTLRKIDPAVIAKSQRRFVQNPEQ